MIFVYILLGIFIILTITFAFLYYSLNSDVKQMSKRIEMINQKETNVLIDSISMQKNIVHLAKLINKNLKHINEYRAKVHHEEIELRKTIANISHDLRTPMTSILGYIQLLKTTANLSEKDQKYISIINSRIEVLKQLIENLFTYSLVYDTVDFLELKEENINAILEDAIAMYYNELIEKNFEIKLNIPNQPIYKVVDKLALKRVFGNLVSNVIKYGEGKFYITLTKEEIVFQNYTKYYDKIDVGKIFDRFFTVTTARNNSSMGLGLTISKNLIEKMQGTINARIDKDMLTMIIKLNDKKPISK